MKGEGIELLGEMQKWLWKIAKESEKTGEELKELTREFEWGKEAIERMGGEWGRGANLLREMGVGIEICQGLQQRWGGILEEIETAQLRVNEGMGKAIELMGQMGEKQAEIAGLSGKGNEMTGARGGGNWVTLLGGVLNFGGWFHEGGLIGEGGKVRKAHKGLFMEEEEGIFIGRRGEGILPEESMRKLGRRNFERIRQGEFGGIEEKMGGGTNITINIQTLDRTGIEKIDWEKIVREKIEPKLKKVSKEWIRGGER